MKSSALSQVVESLADCRLLVVGDLMLDRFVRGSVSRVSPEAPVPLLREDSIEEAPGGAANLARNLVALGAQVKLYGRIGNDREGQRLQDLLEASGITHRLFRHGHTTVKTRFLAGGRQVLRVDREDEVSAVGDADTQWLTALAAEPAQPVVVSDYAKGLIDPSLLERVRLLARDHFWLADPGRGRALESYRGAALITPNRAECVSAPDVIGMEKAEGPALALAACRAAGSPVLVTLGGEGAAFASRADGEGRLIPSQARPVFDVTGAGDSTLAVIARVLAGGGALDDAMALGMLGGALAVAQIGTAAISLDDLRREL